MISANMSLNQNKTGSTVYWQVKKSLYVNFYFEKTETIFSTLVVL